jgi:non-heme chloroperoxidase
MFHEALNFAHGAVVRLKKIDIPTLVMHGDDDQVVPFLDAGALSAKLIKNAQLEVYSGFPHGMPIIHADKIGPDLLAFIKS